MGFLHPVSNTIGIGDPLTIPANSGAPAVFSLHDNPFAVLGATPQTPLHDLPDAAARIGTPEAAAAVRVLSIPRSRLGAELAFLPGSARAAPVVLGALAHGQRPDPATLSRAARANVVAHLCAAGAASEGEQDRLGALQPTHGDAALADAIDSDRSIAGVPPVQRAAMAAEQEALADRHAAALVVQCRQARDPAARLATLVRAAADGTAASFMRRVAAAWARQSAAELVRVEEDATAAERVALAAPGADSIAAFVAAVRRWAALNAPQRASDSRAGLDHAPALRVVRTWRESAIRLAKSGHPELALPLAQALVDCFPDLPGETPRLITDARDCAGMAEEAALATYLAPLRALIDRAVGSREYREALVSTLCKAPFGPASLGVARELWATFDAAVVACLPSDFPWAVLKPLPFVLAEDKTEAAASAALALNAGVTERAEAAGLDDVVARLRHDRPLIERMSAIYRYTELSDTTKKRSWRAALSRRRHTLAAVRALLPMAEDDAERATLSTRERTLVRQGRSTIIAVAVALALFGGAVAVSRLDETNSAGARYRTAAPQSLASADSVAGSLQDPPPAPAPAAPFVPPASDAPSMPAPVPAPPEPAMPDVRPASVPHFAFPTQTSLPERRPAPGTRHVRSLPEVRWCEFNKVRLQAAVNEATDLQHQGLQPLTDVWNSLCAQYLNRRRDAEIVESEVERDRVPLEREGRDMLAQSQ